MEQIVGIRAVQADIGSWQLTFGPLCSVAGSRSASTGMEWKTLPAGKQLK